MFGVPLRYWGECEGGFFPRMRGNWGYLWDCKRGVRDSHIGVRFTIFITILVAGCS